MHNQLCLRTLNFDAPTARMHFLCSFCHQHCLAGRSCVHLTRTGIQERATATGCHPGRSRLHLIISATMTSASPGAPAAPTLPVPLTVSSTVLYLSSLPHNWSVLDLASSLLFTCHPAAVFHPSPTAALVLFSSPRIAQLARRALTAGPPVQAAWALELEEGRDVRLTMATAVEAAGKRLVREEVVKASGLKEAEVLESGDGLLLSCTDVRSLLLAVNRLQCVSSAYRFHAVERPTVRRKSSLFLAELGERSKSANSGLTSPTASSPARPHSTATVTTPIRLASTSPAVAASPSAPQPPYSYPSPLPPMLPIPPPPMPPALAVPNGVQSFDAMHLSPGFLPVPPPPPPPPMPPKTQRSSSSSDAAAVSEAEQRDSRDGEWQSRRTEVEANGRREDRHEHYDDRRDRGDRGEYKDRSHRDERDERRGRDSGRDLDRDGREREWAHNTRQPNLSAERRWSDRDDRRNNEDRPREERDYRHRDEERVERRERSDVRSQRPEDREWVRHDMRDTHVERDGGERDSRRDRAPREEASDERHRFPASSKRLYNQPADNSQQQPRRTDSRGDREMDRDRGWDRQPDGADRASSGSKRSRDDERERDGRNGDRRDRQYDERDDGRRWDDRRRDAANGSDTKASPPMSRAVAMGLAAPPHQSNGGKGDERKEDWSAERWRPQADGGSEDFGTRSVATDRSLSQLPDSRRPAPAAAPPPERAQVHPDRVANVSGGQPSAAPFQGRTMPRR